MPDHADTAMPASRAQDSTPGPGNSAFAAALDESSEHPTAPPVFNELEDEGEFDEFDDYDFGDDEPADSEYESDTQPGEDSEPAGAHPQATTAAPERTAPVSGGARERGRSGAVVKTTGTGIPAWLETLCALPGAEREEFEAIEPRRAWVRLVCVSKSDKLPLAHLSPNPVDVLHGLGFKGHVRATVYEDEQAVADNDPAFYCAFTLPAREGEQQPSLDPILADEILNLREELDRMRAEGGAEAGSNPARLIRKALKQAAEVDREVNLARKELRERLGLSAAEGAGQADAEPEEDEGGTLEALLAVGLEQGQKIIQTPTARKLGRGFVGWLMRKFGPPPGVAGADEADDGEYIEADIEGEGDDE